MTRHTLFDVLDVLKFAGILLLVLMFIHFNTSVANQAQDTKAIASSTNRVVKSQGDILKAIKQVTIDTQLTAQQQTAIIICMLQVPVENRTTDLQAQCRSQSTSVALSTSATVPSAPQQPSKVFVSSPSAQSAPIQPKAQADNPPPASKPTQPTTLDRIPVLGGILKTLGL